MSRPLYPRIKVRFLDPAMGFYYCNVIRVGRAERSLAELRRGEDNPIILVPFSHHAAFFMLQIPQ